MTISVTSDYGVALPQGNLLGNMGENKLRKIRILHPIFENATYILKLLYNDGIIYECAVNDGEMCVDGSLLRYEGNVNAQFFAYADEENESDKVFESDIFTLNIGGCVDGEVKAIPTYEQSEDMLIKLQSEFSKFKTTPIDIFTTPISLETESIYSDDFTVSQAQTTI